MNSSMTAELARQVDLYMERGYPALEQMDDAGFRDLFTPLERLVESLEVSPEVSAKRVPFVAVVTHAVIDAQARQELTQLAGGSKRGIVDKNHGEEGLAPYSPIDQISVPEAPVYLLVDVERGEEFCGVAPKDALPTILGRGRRPLTIDEGVSLITLFPEVLEKNKCFMLAGSRRGDKRVPAMWIADKAPKLGWCWEGNPHSWLGMASAASSLAR